MRESRPLRADVITRLDVESCSPTCLGKAATGVQQSEKQSVMQKDMSRRTEEGPKLLILGGGAVVRELYLPALQRLGWIDRALIVEPLQESLNALEQRYPSARFRVSDYRAPFEDDSAAAFDGVVIALPNQFHQDAATRALRRGLHVLCEKPLALEAQICREMAEEAERQGRALSVAMVRRLIPTVIAIRRALGSQLLGPLHRIEIEHGDEFHWPADSGSYFRKENGGILVNMGIHYLDMLEDWVGVLTPVAYRDDMGGGVEANAEFELHTRDGASVRLALSYTHALKNTIMLQGEHGTIHADVNDFEACSWECRLTALTSRLQPLRPFRALTGPPDFISAFAEQFAEFGWVIAGHEKPRVDARKAAACQALIDWAYAHREPIHAPSIMKGRARPGLPEGRAVVTGGTGFLGVRLVARLNELGFDEIVVPVRSHRTAANLARYQHDRVLTDLRDLQQVRKVIQGARYAFHLAYGSSGPGAAKVTVEGTKNVVDAAIAEGVEALVVVSTASVFGHPPIDHPVNETFPYEPTLGDYGASKAKAERYALRRATGVKTRIIVLNPSAIYGPGGRLFTEFPRRAALQRSFCWIENGRGLLNYTYVENVVDALILAAQCAEAHGERFLISDGVCTLREFLAPLIGEWADEMPSFSREELKQLEAAARPTLGDLARVIASDEAMRVLNGLPVVGPLKRSIERRFPPLYARAQEARREMLVAAPPSHQPVWRAPSWLAEIFGPFRTTYSSDKARRVLGWTPRVTLEEGQRASVAWLEYLGMRDETREPLQSAAQVVTPSR
jgi:nucleoside-diphosphate-sugar epimerase/predicted dehydrogenase